MIGSRYDEIINSRQYERAFNEIWENKSVSISDAYDNINKLIIDSFNTGYHSGYKNGHFEGITDVKLKLMVKLSVHTNLDDTLILKGMEKNTMEIT